MTFNFLKKASRDELADKIRSTSWGSCGSAESALVSLSLHTPGTGSKLIGLPEVTLLTRVAWRPLRLRAHAQYAKCILPLTFGTGLLWARYTGTKRLLEFFGLLQVCGFARQSIIHRAHDVSGLGNEPVVEVHHPSKLLEPFDGCRLWESVDSLHFGGYGECPLACNAMAQIIDGCSTKLALLTLITKLWAARR